MIDRRVLVVYGLAPEWAPADLVDESSIAIDRRSTSIIAEVARPSAGAAGLRPDDVVDIASDELNDESVVLIPVRLRLITCQGLQFTINKMIKVTD